MPRVLVGPKHKVSTALVIKEPRHIALVKKIQIMGQREWSKFFKLYALVRMATEA